MLGKAEKPDRLSERKGPHGSCHVVLDFQQLFFITRNPEN